MGRCGPEREELLFNLQQGKAQEFYWPVGATDITTCIAALLEGFDDHHDDDNDHQNRRHFVHETPVFG